MTTANKGPFKFTLSIPPSYSESSSVASSPVSASHPPGEHPFNDLSSAKDVLADWVLPGKQPRDVYDTSMSWWRAAIRRKLVASVEKESTIIARMQEKIRTPWLDAYFVYTSSLGTHTFFMTVLPAMFFFGLPEMGRGLLLVLALGVYTSSFVKDLICSPRPFAPPVTRLTIGTHHLEYGFPSTHSTNSVSIALFFFSHLHRLASTPASSLTSSGVAAANITSNITVPLFNTTSISDIQPLPLISPTLYTSLCILLVIYTFSIVFGRLYTAMHSFTDCAMGVFLGTLIWWVQTSWEGFPILVQESNWAYSLLISFGIGRVLPSSSSLLINLFQGLSLSTHIESWLTRPTFQVPLLLIPLTLWAVHQHPQPVDDCPCFEDAIAFMAVLMGAFVARWAMCYGGGGVGWTVVMPGSGWLLVDDGWVKVEREWRDEAVWWLVATVKMVIGILTIFTWRIIAKSILHIVLPRIFRLLSRAMDLPHRRFYTPATEYKSVPSEFHLFQTDDEDRGFGLRPIPSVIDLPGGGGGGEARELKMRMGGGGVGLGGKDERYLRMGMDGDKEKDGQGMDVKHYDADVLTKVIVYAGIAVLATEILPLGFELVGWGVKSWV